MKAETLNSDIGYVKGLVDRADEGGMAASIYRLWAFICLVGFAMVDLLPGHVGVFWAVAGPAGGILSGYLGKSSDITRGQLDRKAGMKHVLHWSGMLVFIALAVLLAVTGRIQGVLLSQVIILIVAFGWWTAGVHFDRNFLWISAVMAAGYIASLFLQKFVWVGTGMLMFLALMIMAPRKRGSRA